MDSTKTIGENIMYELKDLFKKWKIAHENDNKWQDNFPMYLHEGLRMIPCEEFKGSFIEDGKFGDCADKVKILFIARESNVLSNEKNENYPIDGEFWMKKVVDVKKNNEKTYYIKESVALSDEDKRRLKGNQTNYYRYMKKIKAYIQNSKEEITDLNDCAYMNLNKRGGYGRCYYQKGHYPRLEEYIDNYKCLIQKEIEILNPENVVFLGYNKGYGDIVMELIKNGLKRNIPCYAVHHPSSTRKYKDLENKLRVQIL